MKARQTLDVGFVCPQILPNYHQHLLAGNNIVHPWYQVMFVYVSV
jgi:hypothetical protein